MKKTILIGIGILLLVAIVVAQVVLNNADFTVPEKDIPPRYSGNVTFTVDGKEQGYCYLDRSDMNIDYDFERCLQTYYPGKKITNARDWMGRNYMENPDTKERSFDETKLDGIPEETTTTTIPENVTTTTLDLNGTSWKD